MFKLSAKSCSCNHWKLPFRHALSLPCWEHGFSKAIIIHILIYSAGPWSTCSMAAWQCSLLWAGHTFPSSCLTASSSTAWPSSKGSGCVSWLDSPVWPPSRWSPSSPGKWVITIKIIPLNSSLTIQLLTLLINYYYYYNMNMWTVQTWECKNVIKELI